MLGHTCRNLNKTFQMALCSNWLHLTIVQGFEVSPLSLWREGKGLETQGQPCLWLGTENFRQGVNDKVPCNLFVGIFFPLWEGGNHNIYIYTRNEN